MPTLDGDANTYPTYHHGFTQTTMGSKSSFLIPHSTLDTTCYQPYPYAFFQMTGGATTVFSANKQLQPVYGFHIGYVYNPYLGLRLGITGDKMKNGFSKISDTYSFHYINTGIDGMLNITNMLKLYPERRVDIYAMAGFGFTIGWKNIQFNEIARRTNIPETSHKTWGEPDEKSHNSLLTHYFRAGIAIDFNINRHWSAGAEIMFTNVTDSFNSKFNGRDDWIGAISISLKYKFARKKCKKDLFQQEDEIPVRHILPDLELVGLESENFTHILTSNSAHIQASDSTNIPTIAPTHILAGNVKIPENAICKVNTDSIIADFNAQKEKEAFHDVCHFKIRKSGPIPEEMVNRCKEWLAEDPERKLKVSGYADRGTGNHRVNLMYARRRATAFVQKLIAAGADSKRIIMKVYGDWKQPFTQNNKNRCVIVERLEDK